MKNKNLHDYRFGNSLFRERCVYEDKTAPAPAPESAEAGKGEKPPVAPSQTLGEAASVKKDTAASLDAERAERQRDEIREQADAQTHAELDQAFGVDTPREARIDEWKATIQRDYKHINAGVWQPENISGLERMKKEWIAIGIPVENNSFYENIFRQLSKCSDTNFLNTKPTNIQQWYMNPREHLADLQSYDNDFFRAWKFYESVKSFALDQDKMQKVSRERVKDLDTDPIATKIVDGLGKNYDKFTEAVRNRDWATAGMYVVGIWAIYKSVKELTHDKKDSTLRWMAYGLAAYTGLKFAENAGYDILKKVGLREMEAEVMGTPLESISRLEIPEAGSIDYGVFMKTSELNLASLYKLYTQTHHTADDVAEGFINPAEFPSAFPQFANYIPSRKKDDAEYARVGHELYMVAHVLRLGYEKTLMVDQNSDYYGKSFEDALKDPLLKQSKVRHFTGILLKYAPMSEKSVIFEPEAVKLARTRIVRDTCKNLGATIDNLPLDAEKHVLGGKIMNYPVVIVVDPNTKVYRIFAKQEYIEKNGNLHDSLALGEIPFQGDSTTQVNDLELAIKAKMTALIAPIKSQGGRILQGVTYADGHWTGKLTIPAAKGYPVEEREAVFEVIPLENGRMLLEISGTPFHLNMDYFSDREHMHAGILLAQLVWDEDYAALRPFYEAGKIDYVDDLEPKNDDPRFKMKLAGEEVIVTYDISEKKYVITDEDQKRLIRNPKFRQDYVAAVGESPELVGVFDDLKNLAENAPENFHIYFLEGMKSWFTEATLDEPLRGVGLDFISGSVPDYYTYSVLDAKRMSLLYALQGGLRSAKSFADVVTLKDTILGDAKARLQGLSQALISENINLKRQGKKWDRRDFILRVIEPIQSAGLSRTYGGATKLFEADAIAVLNLSGSDVSKTPHNELAELKGVFAFYTAYLDTEKLDALKYPVPSSRNPKKDLNIDPYYRVAYFTYVKNEIIRKRPNMGEWPLPNPEAWDIKEYEEWKGSQLANVIPLDPIDAQGPMAHDTAARDVISGKPQPTELEKYYLGELTRAFDIMKSFNDIRGSSNPAAIEKYKQDIATSGQLTSEANLVCSSAGTSRSAQIKEVERMVNIHRMYILEDPDEMGFWIKISLKDRLKLFLRD